MADINPTPKHDLKTTVKIPSLKGIIHGVNNPPVKVVAAETAPDSRVQSAFSAEQLNLLWRNYLLQFKDKGLLNECLILDREISLNDFTIGIRLDNVIQEDHLNSFKMDLLEYLRRNLNNNLVTINIEIKQEDEIKKLYTSKEKYLHLADKYPLLDELRLRLGLELHE